MDFGTFTPQQKQSVQHREGPLFIAAGAGSGKTFTLQQRIAYALLPESGPALSSVDEVLAITFMEKAAAEIKARVRSALRAEGMAEEALKVDSAWISTIHGMCSRILREHALEAGIDPAFRVLSEFDARRLRQEAIEEVLSAARSEGAYEALFAEYGATAAGFNGVSVFDMLDALLAKAVSFARGLDAVCLGAPAPAAGAIARRLLLVYEDALAYGLAAKASRKKASATMEAALAACDEACRALEDALARGAVDYRSLAALLPTLPALTKTSLGRNDETAAQVALAVPSALDEAYRNVNAALARPFGEELLALARRVDAVYQRAMDASGVLDNNGLLHRTLRLLSARGDIAASYQRRFKLVMVDEFQDTNQLQVDLIKLVAGHARLCTVGDAQQSIYRFNGADVTVFERQRSSVREAHGAGVPALEASLDRNFRSHADILAFVRCVCSQRRVFGDGFLDLEPARVPQEGRYFGEGPRLEVQLVSYQGSKADAGAVEAEAAGIAARFAALREAGHKPGDMVVLLGKMSAADIYAAALRAQGFECVFGGGRSFFQLEEVQTVRCLLAALANANDSRALFAVLSSPLLHLSADDFLVLSTCADGEGKPVRRSLGEGLVALAEARERAGGQAAGQGDACASAAAGGLAPSPALAFAASLFARARAEVKRQRPSRVLKGVLVDSGWLARLEAQGTEGVAVAANILKAVRMVEELERKPGYGLARVARDFSAMAESDSSGPASLSVSGQNAVRIMTIHKSKGLEFPIVAVAAYEPWGAFSDSFALTAAEGTVYLSLSLKNGKAKPAKKLSVAEECVRLVHPRDAEDAAQFARAVRAFDGEEEVREAQRKFYVACTRASEYLLVSGMVPYREKAEDALAAYRGAPLLDDVRAALMGDEVDFPDQSALLPYGGSAPLRFQRVFASAEQCAGEGGLAVQPSADEPACHGTPTDEAVPSRAGEHAHAAASERPFSVPVLSEAPVLACEALSARADVFSYSSIAPHEDHLPVLERDDLTSASSASRRAAQEDDAAAAEDAPLAAFEFAPLGAGPSATDVGSAFHRAGQLAVERLPLVGALVKPQEAAIDAIARRYGIDDAARARLDQALDRWFASGTARAVEAFPRVRAEVPFMVRAFDVADGAPRFLEGEIDLLAEAADGTHALVIDYKTGGSPQETPERLQQKHRLQAMCYAYALLTVQKYARVHFAFVRVEQPDPACPSEPQAIHYDFDNQDVPALRQAIEQAYRQGANI